jgi:hypothetical protein
MAGSEMRNHRITDDEAAALLRGRTPHARHELSPLAAAVSEFRGSSLGTPPRPSAAVASRLDLDRVSTIVAFPPENPDMTASPPLTAARSARRSRVALEWFAGLGLAAKIAIGATAAAAVGVTGAGAAGAAGVLPAPAQEVFEQVTGTHPGGEHVSESGVENSEFGLETAENARQKGEEQRQSGLETAEEHAGNGVEVAEEHADEHAEAGLENAAENAGAGVGTGTGAPEGAGEGAGAPEGAGDAADGAGSVADEKAKDGAAGD